VKNLICFFISLLLILFLDFRFTLADGPPIQWERAFGGTANDVGEEIQPTMDGGYIIVGQTWSFGPKHGNVYLIKTDSSGNIQWERSLGGSGWDVGYSVQQTVDRGYIIAGATNSFGAGFFDAYLIKTDPNGNSLWQKTFGESRDEDAYSVHQTSDGGYIVLARTASFGAGAWDIYLIRTDSSGNSLWEKTFGGSRSDWSDCLRQTADGGYILAGITMSFGAGYYDAYLIKIDPNGNSEWQKTFGGSNSDHANSVRQTSDGGYIITGQTSSFGNDADVYLVKTDPNGETLWQRTFGGSDVDAGFSVQQTVDGGYIVAGTTLSFGAGDQDAYLIKTDPNGNSEWQKSFGGSDRDLAYSVLQTVDGGYILAGRTDSFGPGGRDVYLIKLCSNDILPGDLNCSGTVSFEDLGILVTQWVQPRSILYPPADIAGPGDGIVNFLDFSVLAEDCSAAR